VGAVALQTEAATWYRPRMRPCVTTIIEALLGRQERVLSLDVIGEAIGAAPLTSDEIERVFEALEAAGRQIQGLTPNVREHLALVLRAARRLKSEHAHAPSIEAIALETGVNEGAVRAALLYASVLGR
jgi:hypothetical protein